MFGKVRFAASGDRRRARIDWPPDLVDQASCRAPRLPFARGCRADRPRPDLRDGHPRRDAVGRPGKVAIAAAGTSDQRVATEAARTLEFSGVDAEVFVDIGVAGLWRLEARLPELRAADIVIVVAGMDAALVSVMGGLVGAPIIGVPTSVGYGVAEGGSTALNSALASCAQGWPSSTSTTASVLRVLRFGCCRCWARTVPARDDRVVRRWGGSERRHVARRLRRRRCAARGAVGVDRGTRPRRHAVPSRSSERASTPPGSMSRCPTPPSCGISPTSSSFSRQLDAGVRTIATAVFERLAEAEARVHGTSIDEVHFHEVGALDSIADIVGAAACVVHLGLDRIHCSALSLGSGSTRGAHGPIPIPAPAVLEVLTGWPRCRRAPPVRSTTPTGAAVLATIVDTWCPMPPMTVTAVGKGLADETAIRSPTSCGSSLAARPDAGATSAVATRARDRRGRVRRGVEAGVVITSAEGVGGLERDEPVE